ncbi:hypothetical protein [Desulfonatronum thiosulfatophilum]|uniref:hypothetical protein n=1 Tax=Desulfonatronum thiosulfatophilum TaxID=617002 RepID=UPI00111423E3|nr:hypothetical protein [Desulfonatronum thiosulfatophilum]
MANPDFSQAGANLLDQIMWVDQKCNSRPSLSVVEKSPIPQAVQKINFCCNVASGDFSTTSQ